MRVDMSDRSHYILRADESKDEDGWKDFRRRRRPGLAHGPDAARRCCRGSRRRQPITGEVPRMAFQPYSQLVRYKQWADRGLYDVVAQNLARLDAQDAVILVRILDHIHVVDQIF